MDFLLRTGLWFGPRQMNLRQLTWALESQPSRSHAISVTLRSLRSHTFGNKGRPGGDLPKQQWQDLQGFNFADQLIIRWVLTLNYFKWRGKPSVRLQNSSPESPEALNLTVTCLYNPAAGGPIQSPAEWTEINDRELRWHQIILFVSMNKVVQCK